MCYRLISSRNVSDPSTPSRKLAQSRKLRTRPPEFYTVHTCTSQYMSIQNIPTYSKTQQNLANPHASLSNLCTQNCPFRVPLLCKGGLRSPPAFAEKTVLVTLCLKKSKKQRSRFAALRPDSDGSHVRTVTSHSPGPSPTSPAGH